MSPYAIKRYEFRKRKSEKMESFQFSKEKLDIKLIPYDIFNLPQEEKQKLRDLLASYGFVVEHANWEGVKCFGYPNYKLIQESKLYTEKEFNYLVAASTQCLADCNYYHFNNGNLIRVD
jgi:hypothetical protein